MHACKIRIYIVIYLYKNIDYATKSRLKTKSNRRKTKTFQNDAPITAFVVGTFTDGLNQTKPRAGFA